MSVVRAIVLSLLTFGLLFATPVPAHAQGCTQCRDNTASTSAATRRAYRHAIVLLTMTASGIFLTGVTLLRRNR